MSLMRFTLKLGLLLALVPLASATLQARTQTIVFGRTSVALNTGFVSALDSLHVVPGVVRPSELEEGKVTFPVTVGAIDLQTARGEISHSGGLTLTAGNTVAALLSSRRRIPPQAKL